MNITTPSEKYSPRQISTWLFLCCGLVFAIVMVGAITRLTGSGLSITEWNVLMGTIPPLSHEEWVRVFDLYKQSPQFKKENFWMELQDFEKIFFWEWAHRFLARLIGLAYALPLAWFWIRRKIPPGYGKKLLFLVLLIGFQGFIGWYMVASGLINRPSVSHYRLALHLSLAFFLYALSFWHALSLRGTPKTADRNLFIHTLIVMIFFVLTFAWGAFTAGLDAGLIYNETFPKMGAHWIPAEIWHGQSPLLNLLENPAGVQFVHRWLAMLTGVAMISLWISGMRNHVAFPALHALGIMVFIQVGLGIATLFSGVALPLAVAHQSGALIILTLLTICLYKFKN